MEDARGDGGVQAAADAGTESNQSPEAHQTQANER